MGESKEGSSALAQHSGVSWEENRRRRCYLAPDADRIEPAASHLARVGPADYEFLTSLQLWI